MGAFKHKQAIITIVFAGYLALIYFTNISLAGFWTDIFFSIVLSISALRITFKNKTYKRWLTLTLRITTVICSIIVFTQGCLKLIDPFSWNTLKVRTFYFQKVDGRLFNAYFEPVGAGSGGEGNFWITESPKYFPIIERPVYYQHAVLHNFKNDTFDGSPIDNYEVVRYYIKEEIIDKHE